jgi:hypothetical protein
MAASKLYIGPFFRDGVSPTSISAFGGTPTHLVPKSATVVNTGPLVSRVLGHKLKVAECPALVGALLVDAAREPEPERAATTAVDLNRGHVGGTRVGKELGLNIHHLTGWIGGSGGCGGRYGSGDGASDRGGCSRRSGGCGGVSDRGGCCQVFRITSDNLNSGLRCRFSVNDIQASMPLPELNHV